MNRRTAFLLLGLAVLAAVVCGLLVYREALRHGFSAREKPWAIEAFVARRLRGLATGYDVKNQTNPLKPTPAIIANARDHFADHCATCHANNGSGRTAINEGLYPSAPDLREETTQNLTDGEILNIIKNGIRFTGMPGWGGDDEENWKLVLFIRHLPQLSEEELQLMRELQSSKSEPRDHDEERPNDQHGH